MHLPAKTTLQPIHKVRTLAHGESPTIVRQTIRDVVFKNVPSMMETLLVGFLFVEMQKDKNGKRL